MERNAALHGIGGRTPRWLHPDRMIAAVAGRQHGVISREQLELLGFTRHEIHHLVQSGRLHRVHRAVFAVGHVALTWRGRVSAAVLACGLDAVASHLTAGALHSFFDESEVIHVTDARRRTFRGIRTHRSPVPPEHRRLTDGIPLTSPPRTLLDLAGTLSRNEFSRAYEEADRLRLVDEGEARELIARSNGHRGTGLFAAMLDETFAHAPTKLELERRFYDLVCEGGLPVPQVNVWVEGRLVDALWPEHRLIVELDSRTYHRTDAKVERDYAASAELKLAGYEVLRFTWKQVTREQELVLSLLRLCLSR